MNEPGHAFGQAPRRLGPVVALNRPAEQIELLVSGGINGEVQESALDFGPFVTHLSRQPVCVFFECLMKDADDNQSPTAARGAFCELLKQVDIGPIVRRRFQELAHFVDEHRQAPAGPGIACSDRFKRVENAFALSRPAAPCRSATLPP